MISETEIFNISGPSYLTNVDWSCEDHRRSVIASVVQGVYVLEHDRQQNRLGPKSVAPAWWEFFHFYLNNVLVDNADHSMFGVVLELKLPPTYPKNCSLNAPKYLIAFRGTLTGPDTRSRDFHLDLKCILNRLHYSSRFQLAVRTIDNTVAKAGPANVWLAGHSLGSAIALLAGKNMVKKGYSLPTYLFNSPFTSAPLERINHQTVKQGIHIVSSVAKAGLSAALKSRCHNGSHLQENDPFAVLSHWLPYLFVNPADHICSGYLSYFGHRETMEKIGAGKIEKLATKHTVESLLSCALDRNSEPLHLLPSAQLIVNMGQTLNFRAAHGIEQWWDPNLRTQSHVYVYN
ncbi:hypothetical protein L6164_016326 [Bauhinia variegata]|uniref:Uncharacterized protein n=1 Tax=Bauhinia variegata TaxID=167791 RepID=A0ACB9NP77_BAUVA|nr:hypothetical protein L6164_016326 [Bauhinia variegata]